MTLSMSANVTIVGNGEYEKIQCYNTTIYKSVVAEMSVCSGSAFGKRNKKIDERDGINQNEQTNQTLNATLAAAKKKLVQRQYCERKRKPEVTRGNPMEPEGGFSLNLWEIFKFSVGRKSRLCNRC